MTPPTVRVLPRPTGRPFARPARDIRDSEHENRQDMTLDYDILVIGGGHSIGVPIAVSADHSFIASSATMTIHPVRLTGMVIGVPATMEYLERMQDRVVAFVTAKSHISEAKFRELMMTVGELSQDIGTVVVGPKAVEYGLIDSIGSIGEALAKLEELIAERKGQ